MTHTDVVEILQNESAAPPKKSMASRRDHRAKGVGLNGEQSRRARATQDPERDGQAERHAPVSTTDELLRVLIAVTGRMAIPESRLRAIVRGSGKAADKYVSAYNLCDSAHGVREIARLTALDPSNLSKAITRWVAAGVVFRLGEDARPVHLYGLSDSAQSDESASETGEEETGPGPTPPVRSRRHAASKRPGAVVAMSAGVRGASSVDVGHNAKGLLELPLGCPPPAEGCP